MRFMNDYDIDDARRRYASHPILGPATRTLSNLRDAANANSDGWAYWPKPTRAAEKLMALIEGDEHPGGRNGARYDDERTDATEAKLRKAYGPIKSFRTRESIDFQIVEPGATKTVRVEVDVERATLRETWEIDVAPELEGEELREALNAALFNSNARFISQTSDNEEGRTIDFESAEVVR